MLLSFRTVQNRSAFSDPLDPPGRPLILENVAGVALRWRSDVGGGGRGRGHAPLPTGKRPLGQTRPEAANAWKV